MKKDREIAHQILPRFGTKTLPQQLLSQCTNAALGKLPHSLELLHRSTAFVRKHLIANQNLKVEKNTTK
jgi:hypothetical protein